MKNEKIIILSLSFISMILVGVLINTYDILSDEKIIDIIKFNKVLLKSVVISFVILIVIILSNYRKFKS